MILSFATPSNDAMSQFLSNIKKKTFFIPNFNQTSYSNFFYYIYIYIYIYIPTIF